MILSGTVTLDPAAHAASTDELRARLEDLDARRRRADRSIEGVLASWRGGAADAFRETWQEWSRVTATLVDDLAAASQALDLARADLVRADASSASSSHRLDGLAS
jgi:WXG100 family type VII secretion target